MIKKYKIPCCWQMYGYLDVEAESWDEAIEEAEADDTPQPTDGDYVEASFEVDHDTIEFEREEERQQIRRKVDGKSQNTLEY